MNVTRLFSFGIHAPPEFIPMNFGTRRTMFPPLTVGS